MEEVLLGSLFAMMGYDGGSGWTRRRFLSRLAMAGLLMGGCGKAGTKRQAGGALLPGDEWSEFSAGVEGTAANRYLREVGRSFAGNRLRILTESTPPSLACRRLVEAEFSRLTGIEVEWIVAPLERVYARTQVDVARQAGHHDIFYIDQSWLGKFRPHLELVEQWRAREDLAYPDWDWEDFLAPLVRHTASFGGDVIAVPYDITIFIGMVRKDLFSRHGVAVPEDLGSWLAAARKLDAAMAPEVRGTTGQMRVGHYSLLCHFSTWLWGHGGSFMRADGSPALEEAEALEAMAYLKELSTCMPERSLAWDWTGEARSFAHGRAAFYGSWAEFFPMFDDPAESSIVGLAEPVAMPAARRLRAAEACGFGECPGMSHQGGSGIALSRYSKNKEAGWVFLQWLTSRDVAVRASLLGSGASATRESVFKDPRIVRGEGLVGPGTTRHFAVVRRAILESIGTEPHHPRWPDVAMKAFPVELGKLVSGQQSVAATGRAMNELARRELGG